MAVEESFIVPPQALFAVAARESIPNLPEVQQLLLSSCGFGVLASGRGRSIIAAAALREFWKAQMALLGFPFEQTNRFKLWRPEEGISSRHTSAGLERPPAKHYQDGNCSGSSTPVYEQSWPVHCVHLLAVWECGI